MSGSRDDLRESIDRLTEEVRSLKRRVQALEQASRGPREEVRSEAAAPAPPARAPVKESHLSVGGAAALMSRGAVISLVLLLALVLRTLTDSGTLAAKPGTMLGIGYATLLEVVGWFMYRRRSSFAPIFSISGALLLAAVVLETYASFGSISILPAYGLLAVAGGGMAVISRQFHVAIPVNVGTVAVMLAAVSMGFPNPDFTALSLFLVAVNAMAFTAVNLPRARWLRIVVFVFTAAVLFLWGYKLRYALLSGAGPDFRERLSQPGVFYAVILFYLVIYVGVPAVAIWRRVTDERRPFDHVLPSLAAGWAYLTCLMVISASGKGRMILGVAGVVFATALLGMAAVKGRRAGTRSRGTTTFAFPAALLLALSFRDVSGESVVALAILSWGALSLAWLSVRWLSDGVRVTSYVLQATVLGASFLLLLLEPAGDHPGFTSISMAVTALVAFVHYRLARRTPPAGLSAYFTRFDPRDLSGAVPLLVSVGAGFLTLRAVLFTVTAGSGSVFQAGETVLINAGALALFLVARVKRNAEMKWIAVLVTVIGGGKVFLYDLFRVKGLPVVMSVLSFVLAAAAGSLVLGRWSRLESGPVIDRDGGD